MSRQPNHTQTLWRRFQRQRRAFAALVILGVVVVVSLGAELIVNDRPIVMSTSKGIAFPLLNDVPETAIGGELATAADFNDSEIATLLSRNGHWAIWPIHHASPIRMRLDNPGPSPAPPSREHPLGTDDRGRDIVAQLLYSTRTSLVFGTLLATVGVLLGLLIGSLQGYYGGRTDLFGQRLIEIWSAVPELYLLIILTAFFEPSLWLLGILLALFSWIGLSDVMRAEMLRHREHDYVAAARSLGLSHWQILRRHLIPNSLAPAITFFPFRVSAAIFALSSLDFLGLGFSGQGASLGTLIAQGKDNLDAWWIGGSAVVVLVAMMVLLVLIGEGLRDALDPRQVEAARRAP